MYKSDQQIINDGKKIKELKKDIKFIASMVDPFDTTEEEYKVLRKYIKGYPKKHPMSK